MKVTSKFAKVYVNAGEKFQTSHSRGKVLTEKEGKVKTKMQCKIGKEAKKLKQEHWIVK